MTKKKGTNFPKLRRHDDVMCFHFVLTFNEVIRSLNVKRPSLILVMSVAHCPEVRPSNSSFNLPWNANRVMPRSAENCFVLLNSTIVPITRLKLYGSTIIRI